MGVCRITHFGRLGPSLHDPVWLEGEKVSHDLTTSHRMTKARKGLWRTRSSSSNKHSRTRRAGTGGSSRVGVRELDVHGRIG